jgi:hypothetical protein
MAMVNHPEFDRYTLQQRYAAYVGLAQLLYEQKRTREREFYADRFVKYLLARKRIEIHYPSFYVDALRVWGNLSF